MNKQKVSVYNIFRLEGRVPLKNAMIVAGIATLIQLYPV